LFDPLVIAIIDDDEAVREAFCDLLQVVGLPCRSFDRAEVFLGGYSPGVFGCVITDMRMPGISGLELLERIKAMDSSMPVIVVTSHWDPLIRSRTLEGGAHAFLTKPVAEDTLLQHLRSALCHESLPGGEDGREPSDG
jgi:two-component system, LuxR family, response regulator FixJ